LLAKYPGVEIAYCAHPFAVDVRLGWGDGRVSEAQTKRLVQECVALLGDDVFCVGSDSLAEAVADLLRGEEKNLAVAESGTGGQLASVFTDLPGATKFFQGGVVCYRNSGKVILLDIPECLISQHGAVSAETAVAMASGVSEKLVADFGLSITCCAGSGASCRKPADRHRLHRAACARRRVRCKRLAYPGYRGGRAGSRDQRGARLAPPRTAPPAPRAQPQALPRPGRPVKSPAG